MKRQKKTVSKKPKVVSKIKTNSPRKKTTKQKNLKPSKAILLSRAHTKTAKKTAKKEVNFNSIQQEVSQAKFFTTPEPPKRFSPPSSSGVSQGLPQRYQEDKIVAQVRDPWWIHVYWEIKDSSIEDIKRRLGNRFEGAKSALRIYDVSNIIFNGKNAHRYFDIEIGLDIQNWYIDVAAPGRSWCVDIGFRLKDGNFIVMARSNAVTTPLDGPSWITDEEWMIPDDQFARLYGMGVGFGHSSPRKGFSERLRFPIGSPGMFSITSPIKKRPQEKGRRGFWFRVDTELIVHGATEPNAKVTVCGQPVKLNSDGTFSLQFSLPDGQQTVPVEARSFDGIEYQSVTPIVSKETRQGII